MQLSLCARFLRVLDAAPLTFKNISLHTESILAPIHRAPQVRALLQLVDVAFFFDDSVEYCDMSLTFWLGPHQRPKDINNSPSQHVCIELP